MQHVLFSSIFLSLVIIAGCQSGQKTKSQSDLVLATPLRPSVTPTPSPFQILPPKNISTASGVFLSSEKSPSKKGWNHYLQGSLARELLSFQTKKKNSLKKDPSLKNDFFILGKKALGSKQGHIAVSALHECLSLDPYDLECHWELGWSFFLLQEFNKSLAEFEWVKKKQPHRKGLNALMKKITLQSEYREQSKKYLKKAPKTFLTQRSPSASLVKIKAVGDTMLGSGYPENSLPPDDLSILELISPQLAGSDLLFVNYEGTLCDVQETIKCTDESEGSSCFAFRTPPIYAEHLKAVNVNLVSLANNHIMDFGEDCRAQTEKNLDDQLMLWSGRKGTLSRFEVKNIQYSFIAFHSAAHTNSTIDWSDTETMIRAEKEGGRVVVISFHGGSEGLNAMHVPNPPAEEFFFGENRGNVVDFAHRAVDAGADLVLGSGPHVVRGMEFYKERLIAYSLGNFGTYKLFNLWGFNAVGLILEVELEADGRFNKGRIISTRQVHFGVPVLDEDHIAVDLIRMLSLQDFPATGVSIAKDGTLGFRLHKKRSVADLADGEDMKESPDLIEEAAKTMNSH